MEFDTGMSRECRAAVAGALSKLLADTYVLYLKTQNVHWNISGVEFYSLHLLAEKQYEELAEAVDELAERIRALGFFVEGSMGAFLKLTSIQEDPKLHPKHVLIEHLIKGHELLMREGRALTALAEKHRDHGTIDLLGRRLIAHEKMAWMLRESI